MHMNELKNSGLQLYMQEGTKRIALGPAAV